MFGNGLHDISDLKKTTRTHLTIEKKIKGMKCLEKNLRLQKLKSLSIEHKYACRVFCKQ